MGNFNHVFQWVVIGILIVGFVYFGGNSIDKVKQDYELKISNLNEKVDKLGIELSDAEEEIGILDARVITLDRELISINREHDTQIVDLNQQLSDINDDYDSQVKEYKLQISDLNQKYEDIVVDSEQFSSIIPKVIDATVSIYTDKGQGSGAIISKDGLIVTNHHVIDGITRASAVTYNGNVYNIRLVGSDETNDLAVLEIISSETFNYFEFGDSDNLKIGQKVVALGNPAGLSFTATEGIVSSPSRRAGDGLYYIQTDATLNPGNSGGPLINSLGELIGIIDFKVDGYEELGFAIPSNRAQLIIDEII